MTLQEARAWAHEALNNARIENAAREANWMVETVTGIEVTQFPAHRELELSMEQDIELCAFVSRRCKHEPLQYILGEAPFYGRLFKVRPGVLIPRADTEVLCEEALKRIADKKRALEICCGSGAVAITLALEAQADVFAGEISQRALDIARENMARYQAKVDLRKSDLFEAFEGSWYDLIVCNPPYIKSEELEGLMPEVRDYEPMLALDGGEDGLDFYRRIIPQAIPMLHPNGELILEIGHTQADAVHTMMRQYGYQSIFVRQDLNGHTRVVGGSKS